MLSYSRRAARSQAFPWKDQRCARMAMPNKRLYGKEVTAEDIVEESRLSAPDSAHALISRCRRLREVEALSQSLPLLYID